MATVYFGEKWDAPMFEGAEEIPAPVGRDCSFCDESVAEGDSGILQGHIDAKGGHSLRPVHIECFLRSLLGDIEHLRKRCTCYGGTAHDQRPYREQARAVIEELKKPSAAMQGVRSDRVVYDEARLLDDIPFLD